MYTRIATLSLTVLLALGVGACDLLDVENPNTLEEDQLSEPTAAEPMLNGLQANVTEGVTSILAPYSSATDELIWVGSRSAWLGLSRGFIGDPNNEFTDTRFLEVAEAEWMSRNFISRLEAFQEEGTLSDDAILAEAYLHGAIIKTTVGDMFSNWAFSDQQEAGEPIGEENMTQLYDQALDFVNKGLALDAGFGTELTAMKARILFSRSVWDKVHPAGNVNTNSPLADGEDAANAATAAQTALDLMEADDFALDLPVTSAGDFDSDVAFQVNQRDELIPDTTVHVNTETPNGGVVSEIIFEDPVDNVPHPQLQRIINTRYGGDLDEFVDVTVVSAREMHLILAEVALANGDTGPGSTFRTQINELRALNGLSAYDGPDEEGVSRIDLIEDSRQANLYLQGRRLVDMYRFDEQSTFDMPPGADAPDQGWQPSSSAVQSPGTFFPLPNTEIRANPNV
jgi:hypothetical protein